MESNLTVLWMLIGYIPPTWTQMKQNHVKHCETPMREKRIDFGWFWKILVLMVDWDFHFTEHIIRRPGLPFYTRAGLTPQKNMLNLGYFTWFFKCLYIFTVGNHFAFFGLRFELSILQQLQVIILQFFFFVKKYHRFSPVYNVEWLSQVPSVYFNEIIYIYNIF